MIMVKFMQRYMVNNSNLELDISDKKHIINVMRMTVNEKFQIVYDKKIYTCLIEEICKKERRMCQFFIYGDMLPPLNFV